MPDRTQTLSVEITDDEASALRCAEGGPGFSAQVRDHKQAVLAKLRNALSQPEHQGDEETQRERDEWRARYRREKKARKVAQGKARHWRHNHDSQVFRKRQVVARLKAVEAEAKAAQPPAPALSGREPIIKPGEEWDAAVQIMLNEATKHGERLLANDYCAADFLHLIIDAVEAVRYAGVKPKPIIDRAEA